MMKSFSEFKQSLTREVLDDMARNALDKTHELLDSKFDKDDLELRFATINIFYTEVYGLALLEKYHAWISE